MEQTSHTNIDVCTFREMSHNLRKHHTFTHKYTHIYLHIRSQHTTLNDDNTLIDDRSFSLSKGAVI